MTGHCPGTHVVRWEGYAERGLKGLLRETKPRAPLDWSSPSPQLMLLNYRFKPSSSRLLHN
jgi:hypothetical protein